jgi:heat shock protein HslJ
MPLTRILPVLALATLAAQGTAREVPVDNTKRMIGEFVYFADAAMFRPCAGTTRYPVAMEGDYLALERSYLRERREAQQPIVAVLEGRIEMRPAMEGDPRETLLVSRSVGVVPTLSCERALADSPVENSYWRILTLDGKALDATQGRREPSIRFLPQLGRYSATVGCNTLNGPYTLDGTALTLSPGPTTLMACPPPLDAIEQRFVEALGDIAEVIVTGPTAELRNADGIQIAFLGSVALL